MDDPSAIPSVAWRRRLDDIPPDPGHPSRPGVWEAILLLPTAVRVHLRARADREAGREAPINPFDMLDPGPVMGVPLGGLGGGTITRGWRGDFCRWQLQAGQVAYRTVLADQFSLMAQRPGQAPQAVVLTPTRPEGGALSAWGWELDGASATYYALFPRAWTSYEAPLPGLRLTCRQISPAIPHNYVESSTPAAVFVWQVENVGREPVRLGMMFSFQNGTGGASDRAGGHLNAPFRRPYDGGSVEGVLLRHAQRQTAGDAVYEDPLTFAIAAASGDGLEVTTCAHFDPMGDGAELWEDFRVDGRLSGPENPLPTRRGEATAGAVAASVDLSPGHAQEIVFALAWDAPIARFGAGRGWYRRYTRFYGRSGDAAPRLVANALADYPEWELQIQAAQEAILADERLPDWYRAALFNEAYYLVDGGTVWTDGAEDGVDPLGGTDSDDVGHFAYLEGHEYRMYNTYDVHFYASFALTALWPRLELNLQRDVARAIGIDDPEERQLRMERGAPPRKIAGMVPHDLGGPAEDPWQKVNIYDFRDANRWKDLNSKFVLQSYRDFVATQDIDFLAEMWPPIQAALAAAAAFDRDGDGLIENDGIPDQTYDDWAASGPSAYTGGLWLAALQAAAEIAAILDEPTIAKALRSRFERARQAYESLLWNGESYDYDASDNRTHDSIMADQLAGDWYARACGLPGIVPIERARSALQRVFAANVQGYAGGAYGAVNGTRSDGSVDTSSVQSQEVWTGTNYALAAAMLQLGLDAEAFVTAGAIAGQTYGGLGYWFMTPEAWDADRGHRSLAYMRPLAIWAIQWAWDRRG